MLRECDVEGSESVEVEANDCTIVAMLHTESQATPNKLVKETETADKGALLKLVKDVVKLCIVAGSHAEISFLDPLRPQETIHSCLKMKVPEFREEDDFVKILLLSITHSKQLLFKIKRLGGEAQLMKFNVSCDSKNIPHKSRRQHLHIKEDARNLGHATRTSGREGERLVVIKSRSGQEIEIPDTYSWLDIFQTIKTNFEEASAASREIVLDNVDVMHDKPLRGKREVSFDITVHDFLIANAPDFKIVIMKDDNRPLYQTSHLILNLKASGCIFLGILWKVGDVVSTALFLVQALKWAMGYYVGTNDISQMKLTTHTNEVYHEKEDLENPQKCSDLIFQILCYPRLTVAFTTQGSVHEKRLLVCFLGHNATCSIRGIREHTLPPQTLETVNQDELNSQVVEGSDVERYDSDDEADLQTNLLVKRLLPFAL